MCIQFITYTTNENKLKHCSENYNFWKFVWMFTVNILRLLNYIG